MLKLLKIPVNFQNYKDAMISALKKHAIGKLFFTFNKVELSQKIYFSAMIGLYFYNIYQNAVVCYRFYKNLNYISSQFNTLKNYVFLNAQVTLTLSNRQNLLHQQEQV